MDDDCSNVQLSAVDCGEWLLVRVLGALLLLLADKKSANNNNNDDDDANDDSGEKKVTNEVRSLLLAAGVDEATVEQTVKELNWKVKAQRCGCFCCFAILFVANTRTTKRLLLFIVVLTLTRTHIHRQFVQNC